MKLAVWARVIRFVALALACVGPVRAEPAETALQQAEVLFKDGLEDIKRGDWLSACEKFRRSAELEPRASSLVKVGICHRRAGHHVAAWHALQRARALNAPNNPRYRPLLEDETQAELSKIPMLTISASASISGLAVSVDGQAMDLDLLGAPQPIEFGDHPVVATAPGYQRNSMVLKVERGQSYGVVLAMAPNPVSLTAPADRAVEPPSSIPDGPPPHTPSSRRTLGIAIGGLGVAGLAVAGALGMATLDRVEDSNPYCAYPDGSCDPEGVELREQASRLQTAAIGVSVAGGLALATGIYLILVPGERSGDAARSPRASLLVSGTTMVTRWQW